VRGEKCRKRIIPENERQIVSQLLNGTKKEEK